MDSIDKFIKEISEIKMNDNSENIYNNKIIQKNLSIYLHKLKENNPKVMIIGEAPGYRGCRDTGIPFVDEYRMINGSKVLGSKYGYIKTTKGELLEEEMTAKIIWNNIELFFDKVIMWNIYPFHPFKDKNLDSNRNPSAKECQNGLIWIDKLLDIFDIDRIYCIGKASYNRLTINKNMKNYIRYSPEYIRHPSFGGATEFKNGIKKLKYSVII